MIAALIADAGTFLQFYGDKLRFPLFTGFLSLGGFLFASKTFIVVHMKKEVYDTDRYRQRVAEQRKLNKDLPHYKPLRNLNSLLYWAVVSSLGTAVAQVTVGLLPYMVAAVACVSIAAVSLVLLFVCLYQIRENMNSWISDLEEDARERATDSP